MPEALATFKGNIYRKNIHRQIGLHNIYCYGGFLEIIFGHSGVIDTAVTKIVDFVVDFLREFESI
jgi:hypothetical protein